MDALQGQGNVVSLKFVAYYFGPRKGDPSLRLPRALRPDLKLAPIRMTSLLVWIDAFSRFKGETWASLFVLVDVCRSG